MARTVRIILLSLVLLGFAVPVTAAEAADGWKVSPIDTEGLVGNNVSLTSINGSLAVSYARKHLPDEGPKIDYDLKFATASERDGGLSWETQTVVRDGRAGAHSSVEEIDNRPAISFYSHSEDALMFAINDESDGSDEWNIRTVDSDGDVGRDSSLAVVDGRPAIAYTDNSGSNLSEGRMEYSLKLAVNSRSDGSGDWQRLTLDPDGARPDLVSLDDGYAISYWNVRQNSLKLAVNRGPDIEGEWQFQTVDSSTAVGALNSIAILSDQLAISYLDSANHNVKFAINSKADGSGEWQIRTIATEGYLCRFTPMIELDGKPVVLTHDLENDRLRLARSSRADGMGDWSVETVVVAKGGSRYSTMALLDGAPVFAFADPTGSDYEREIYELDLMFARPN